MVSRSFYTCRIADCPSLAEELEFLAANVAYVEKELEVPSESLTFSSDGREVPRPRSITEDELWRKLATAEPRAKGELGNAELEDEIPPFAPIPEGKPTDGTGEITRDDMKMGDSLSEEQKLELFRLILEHLRAFGKGDRLGKVMGFQASIPTEGPLPPPQNLRPAGPPKREVIEKTIEQLLAWDVIEMSESKTASPVVLVWQNNKWRFCIDFRSLNAITVGDAYLMLRADYVFSTLAGRHYFTLLDALKGYHQMEIQPKNREKTAFISHKGLYQYKRLPFGLKNGPAQFQRMMDQIIGGLRWQAALVYIDDLLIYSNSWVEHVSHLRTILKAAG